MISSERLVIAIDPGRCKTGFAVASSHKGPLKLQCVPTAEALDLLEKLHAMYKGAVIIIGNGTTSGQLAELIRKAGYQVHEVEEKNSTMQARKRYFELNPPSGLWRLLPAGLRYPPGPVDEYAALVLAERYLDQPG